MRLRNRVAGQALAGVVVVALGAGQVELADALPEQLFATAEKGRHACIASGCDRLTARLQRDETGKAQQFRVFNLVSGLTLLAASVLAGGLWDWQGPAWTFWTGAACALLALLLVPVLGRTRGKSVRG